MKYQRNVPRSLLETLQLVHFNDTICILNLCSLKGDCFFRMTVERSDLWLAKILMCGGHYFHVLKLTFHTCQSASLMLQCSICVKSKHCVCELISTIKSFKVTFAMGCQNDDLYYTTCNSKNGLATMGCCSCYSNQHSALSLHPL